MVQLTVTRGEIQNDLYQLDKRGNVVLNKVNPADYICPDNREYRLKLTGYSDTFELDGEWGVKTKVRLEWEVVNSKKWSGGRFSTMCNVAWGDKSTLGKIIAALTGEPVRPGQLVELDDLLGLECFGTIEQRVAGATGNVYPTVATYRAVTDDDDEEEPAPAPARGKPSGGGRRGSTTSDDDEPPF